MKTTRANALPFRFAHLVGVFVSCNLALTFLAPPATADASYREGERLIVTGVVRTEAGDPAPDLQVTFQGSRQKLSLRSLKRDDTNHRQINTFTGADGRYDLEWTWYDFFNHFELFVGQPRPDGELQVLARSDLSKRVERGSPIVVNLTVPVGAGSSSASALPTNAPNAEATRSSAIPSPSAERPNAVQAAPTEVATTTRSARPVMTRASRFVKSLESNDELRIYDRFGQPDTVKRFRYPEYLEVSWWYFREGKAYTFRDGQLEREFEFDPVVPF